MTETPPNINPEGLKEISSIVGALDEGFQSLGNKLRDIVDDFQDVNGEATLFSRITKDTVSTLNSISRVNEKLIRNQVDLNDGQLSSKKVLEQIKVITAAREILEQRLLNLTKLTEKSIEEGLTDAVAIQKSRDDILHIEKKIKETIEESTGLYNNQLKRAKEIEAKLGGTGKLLKDISKIPILGNLIDANKALTEAQAKAAEKGSTRAQVIGTAFKSMSESLVSNLFSLESIITHIVIGLIKGSQAMADFRKESGMSWGNAYGLRSEMSLIAISSNDNYITSEKLGKAYSSMTKTLGMYADVLGGEALESAVNLEQRLGFSAKETATLVVNARLLNKNTEEVLKSNIKVANEYNKQHRTTINVKDALRDAANASMGLQATLSFNNDKLVESAAAAKRLGLNLSEVQQISDSLLNFESSIAAELEAELLTGKDINLEKERLLALNGDQKGLAEAITNNAVIQDAFAGKNVLQQEAIAKSLGLTRDKLAQITLQQKFNELSAEEFINRYGEATYESLKAQSATEKFGNALMKITSILGDILALFSPILDFIALIVDNTLVLGIVLGSVIMLNIAKISAYIKSSWNDMKGLVKSSWDFMKSTTNKLPDKVADTGGSITEKLSDKVQDKVGDKVEGVADKVSGAADKTKNVKAGTGVKDFLTNLGKGLAALGKSLANGQAILGLVVLTGAVIGIGYALNLAAPGISAIGAIIIGVFAAIPPIITAVADGFVKFLGSITLEKMAALFLLGPALISLGFGLSIMGASLFFGGGLAILALGGLALMADPLSVVASSITTLASGVKALNVELKSLDTDKLDSLSDFALISSIGGVISSIFGGKSSEGGSSNELKEIKGILQQILTTTGTVYLDNNKVGTTQIMGTYKVQ